MLQPRSERRLPGASPEEQQARQAVPDALAVVGLGGPPSNHQARAPSPCPVRKQIPRLLFGSNLCPPRSAVEGDSPPGSFVSEAALPLESPLVIPIFTTWALKDKVLITAGPCVATDPFLIPSIQSRPD